MCVERGRGRGFVGRSEGEINVCRERKGRRFVVRRCIIERRFI